MIDMDDAEAMAVCDQEAAMDLRVEDPAISDDFRSLVPEAPLPWSAEGGSVLDAEGAQVCLTTPRLAALIVIGVNTCGGFRATLT